MRPFDGPRATKERTKLLPIRGRNEQIAQINASLQAVAHGNQSKVLFLKAAAGTGKSRVLVEAMTLAAKGNFTVINGMPALLGTPHSQADRAAGAVSGAYGPKELRVRLRDALEQGPALVALDDLHLIDVPTLTALRDLVTDLAGLPVLWVLTCTPDGMAETSRRPADLFVGKVSVERLQDLSALTGESLAQLVTDHLGAPPCLDLLTLAESLDDGPRSLIELVCGLAEDGDVCVTGGQAQVQLLQEQPVGTSGRIRVPAPVPPRFAAMMQEKLRPLSAFTTKVLKLASILGAQFTPTDLSAMLDESPVDLLTALDEAFEAGILICRKNDFAFRSDPVWRIVLDTVPPPMRVLLHKQAATVLLEQQGGVEAAALHLVHVAQPGDVEAVRIISDAATKLMLSDPATAATLAMRGMELLKPEQLEHVRLASTAVEALVRAADTCLAVQVAEEAITRAADHGDHPTAALRSWLSMALLLRGRVHEAAAVANGVVADAEQPDDRERAELTVLVAESLTDDSAASRRAERILSAADRPAPAVLASALSIRAVDRWRSGQVDEAITLLHTAGDTDRGGHRLPLLSARWVLTSMLTRIGELTEAGHVARSAAARDLHDHSARAVTALLDAPLLLAQGHLSEADDSARSGIESLAGLCVPMLVPQAWRVRALVALRRGLLAEAEAHLGTLERQFPRDSSRPWWAMRFLLNAHIAETRGGAQAAIEVLSEIWASAGARRELVLEDPAAAACCVRWALDAGTPEVAHMVVDTAKSLCATNRNLGTLRVGALHAQALLDGDLDGLAHASHAHQDPWAQATAAEDHARLLLASGERDAAITELEKALGFYSALDGERDTARVRGELRQLGVRRRHWKHKKRPVSGWDSLTNAERRVAELVANGLTNRQVASQLFVSPHTVGFHLRQVYRKLELRSRVDLIRFKV